MTTHLNRQNAANRARLAQGALAVLLVGGGVAMGVGLHAGSKADAPGELVIQKVDIPKPQTVKPVPVDIDGVSGRLGLVLNAPKPVEVAVVQKVDNKQGPTPPPAATELRFLGAVGVGSMSMALVSDNGKQRFVAVGDRLADGTVESITDVLVRISGATPRTLELAQRGGDVLTKAHRTAQAPGPQVTPGGKPQSLAMVKTASPGGGPPTITKLEGSPVPDYVRPELARRFEDLRQDLRAKQAFGSEQEINEYAAKILIQEDPKSVDLQAMDKQRQIQEKMQSIQAAQGMKSKKGAS